MNKKALSYSMALFFIVLLVGIVALFSNNNTQNGITANTVLNQEDKQQDDADNNLLSKIPEYKGGKKVILPPDDQCFDSDNGKNVYEKGTTLGLKKSHFEDNCMLYTYVDQQLTKTVVDSCSGEFCKLHEGYCKKKELGDLEATEKVYDCSKPFVCDKGTCILPRAKAEKYHDPRSIINIKVYK